MRVTPTGSRLDPRSRVRHVGLALERDAVRVLERLRALGDGDDVELRSVGGSGQRQVETRLDHAQDAPVPAMLEVRERVGIRVGDLALELLVAVRAAELGSGEVDGGEVTSA